MKAILEFDLNDLDDRMAHDRACRSLDMALALWQIVTNTKRDIADKIERALEEDKNFTPQDSLDLVYDQIYEILRDHDVNVERLII